MRDPRIERFIQNNAIVIPGIVDENKQPDPLPLDHDAWGSWYARQLVRRIATSQRCAHDPAQRAHQAALCAIPGGLGHLYWLCTFGLIHEPRADGSTVLPFIPFPRQAELILTIHAVMAEPPGAASSLACEKARGVGATWIDISHHAWEWQFAPDFQGLLIAQTEDDVDAGGEPSSWMWKLDFLLKRQPKWLLPPGFLWSKHRRRLHLGNPATGASIDGTSTTPESGRGDRIKKASIDEANFNEHFRAIANGLAEATNHRFYWSTASLKKHKDYYNLCRGLDGWTQPTYFRFEWWQVPGRDQAWYDAKRTEMKEEDFRREVLIDYRAETKSFVYPMVADTKLKALNPIPGLPVYVAIDDGYRDPTAIVWLQAHPETGDIDVLAGYQNFNQTIAYYGHLLTGELKHGFEWGEREVRLAEYLRKYHLSEAVYYGDRHGDNTELSSGKSPFDVLRDQFGIVVLPTLDPTKNTYRHRQDTLRSILPRCRFNDTMGAPEVLEALVNNRFKDVPTSSQTTTESRAPIHDGSSHYASAMEYFAINYQTTHAFGQYADTGPLPRNTMGTFNPLNLGPYRRRGQQPAYEEAIAW